MGFFSCERSTPHEQFRALRVWAQSARRSCRVERWHEETSHQPSERNGYYYQKGSHESISHIGRIALNEGLVLEPGFGKLGAVHHQIATFVGHAEGSLSACIKGDEIAFYAVAENHALFRHM